MCIVVQIGNRTVPAIVRCCYFDTMACPQLFFGTRYACIQDVMSERPDSPFELPPSDVKFADMQIGCKVEFDHAAQRVRSGCRWAKMLAQFGGEHI